jgi:hypothetical protein
VDAGRILVSPAALAHLEGCSHKDDLDMSRWGEIVGVPRAWERLGTGEAVATNAGARIGIVARGRCKDCENRA